MTPLLLICPWREDVSLETNHIRVIINSQLGKLKSMQHLFKNHKIAHHPRRVLLKYE